MAIWRANEAGATPFSSRFMKLASYGGHSDTVMRLCWSPDGATVASGSSDGTVQIWRLNDHILSLSSDTTTSHAVNTGFAGTKRLACLQGHAEEVYACEWLSAYSGDTGADNNTLLSASGQDLYLWDVEREQILSRIGPPPIASEANVPDRWKPGHIFGIACQRGGPLIAGACSDGRIRFWARSNDNKQVAPYSTTPWKTAMISDCAFSTDGNIFAATAKDGGVLVLDMRTGHVLLHNVITSADDPNDDFQSRPCSLYSCELKMIADRLILIASSSLGKVVLIDVESGQIRFLNTCQGLRCQRFGLVASQQPALLTATLSEDEKVLAAAGECLLVDEEDERDFLMRNSELKRKEIAAGFSTTSAPPAKQKWSPIHTWKL